MKRYISKYDDKNYTYMLKLMNSIGGRGLKYNWLITNIEVYPNDKNINNKLDGEYLILSNDELLNMLEKEDFQWIWGIFSAIPLNAEEKEILEYNLPSEKNIHLSYKSSIEIQHPLADIEIDCIDSTYFAIIFKDSKLEGDFLKSYPNVIESIDSPEDYFTTWENKTANPTFEFSYYKFNSSFSIKNNLKSLIKKDYKIIENENLLYISEENFNDFIKKHPYFDEITLKNGKKGKIDCFKMDNYYNKEQTKNILEKIKKDIPNHNKKIIKFLEKATKEFDGFYIHGI